MKEYQLTKPFTPVALVKFRKRFNAKRLAKINELIITAEAAHKKAQRESENDQDDHHHDDHDPPNGFIRQTTEYGLREITDDFCQEAGFTPHIANIAFESTTPEVICSLVKAGFGNAFIPAYWWDSINTDSLVKLHIENPTCQRTIWLSWAKDHYLSVAARDFSKFMIEYFSLANNNKHSI